MKRKRLLFINRSFWPDNEATGQLLTQLCEDLVQDFDVDVICGHPLHGEKVSDDVHPFGPSLNIHRVNHTRFSKGSIVGRLTNLLTFTASAYRKLKQVPTPDVVITETDPFFLPLLGRKIQRKTGCQYIAYLQDIYPDVAVALGKAREGILVKQLRNMLFNCYQKADRVIVLSEDMKQTCQQHGVSKSSLRVLPNWTDTTTIVPLKQNNPFRSKNGWNDKFLVMYSGNLGLAHELDALLDAAEVLKNRENIHFVIIGDGVQKKRISQRVDENNLTNVTILEKQPYEKLAESLSAADVHFVSLKSGVERCLFPSKVYGILASGTPLLVLASSRSELSQFVSNEQLGEACEIDQPQTQRAESIATAILALAQNSTSVQEMGQRARQIAVQEFDRSVITNKFADLVHETILQKQQTKSLASNL
ncbi:MAG: glycosyltransferase family 4 protein [Planctomycetaceae bacterium]|nr:glycosyltransferase family 4 protein [Planctomycetaceae bacterium]